MPTINMSERYWTAESNFASEHIRDRRQFFPIFEEMVGRQLDRVGKIFTSKKIQVMYKRFNSEGSVFSFADGSSRD